MTALYFVDTNVFVYDVDASAAAKQRRARAWLSHLWQTQTGRVSAQVQNELYTVLTRKMKPGLPRDEARALVSDLDAWSPIAIGGDLLQRALGLEDRYPLSWWDALIVAAAESARCTYLLSEDLSDGQQYGRIRVINPFTVEPGGKLPPSVAHDR